MKSGFCFVEAVERNECVAALELCFGKLRPDLLRLFVERERLLEVTVCMRALSPFEQTHRIGCIVAESFFGLGANGRSATQRQQQNATRREEEFVPKCNAYRYQSGEVLILAFSPNDK